MPRLKWTEEEINVLMKNEDKTMEEIYELFPYRTKESINNKVYYIGLNFQKVRFNDRDCKYMTCTKCNVRKEYSQENFNLKLNYYYCKDCINKLSNITKYQNKHGIKLDFDEMWDTYSPKEWYHFLITSKIDKIPQSLSECNKKEIIKYAIIIYDKRNTRDSIIDLGVKDLKRLKIYGLCRKYYGKSLIEIVNGIFPHYNIRPFEQREVPKGYWNNKENADEFMFFYLNEYLHLDLENIKNEELAFFFKYDFIRNIKFNSLIDCIHIYKHYNSFYQWLDCLFPNLNLNEKDFNTFIGKDNKTKLNSYEEKLIFDFILDKLNISIVGLGVKRKHNFNFIDNNGDKYFPDFVITSINGDEIEKPIIIEYYGFYRNINNEIFSRYKEKTKRKNKYYKSNKDIYFIDLYPDDLKSNLSGVNDKLTSFFMDKFRISLPIAA